MKVTFTCEKCGHVLGEVTSLTAGTQAASEEIARASNRFEREGCPHCSPPTYGPITIGMMTDAIVEVADKWYENEDDTELSYSGLQKRLAEAEARFFLRLLEKLPGLFSQSALIDIDWRQRLLNLAREK